MDVAQLKTWLDSKTPFVLDVRTSQEFAQGHVPGAVNISVQDLPKRLDEIASHKGDKFAVICASGARSAAATSLLHKAGYAGATNVKGGTRAWITAGYPVD
ncbi:MAG: rhodanese-like domain-containing protein [Oligoflexia bacterium]|nr:rhodanese-like domain-containing protein [Oligoflexia bacterium]